MPSFAECHNNLHLHKICRKRPDFLHPGVAEMIQYINKEADLQYLKAVSQAKITQSGGSEKRSDR